jgi:hypothetical protein
MNLEYGRFDLTLGSFMIYLVPGYGGYRPTETHHVVAIHYEEVKPGVWAPWGVTTMEEYNHEGRTGLSPNHWDFAYSKAQEVSYFHNSGGGGDATVRIDRITGDEPTPLWLDRSKITPVGYRGGYSKDKEPEPLSDEEIAALNYRLLDAPLPLHGEENTNPFGDSWNIQEGETIYCSVCNDNTLREDCDLCRHIRWCDQFDWYAGCGQWAEDIGREEHYTKSFAALLEFVGIDTARRLEKSLRAHDYKAYEEYSAFWLELLNATGEKSVVLHNPDDGYEGTIPEDKITKEMEAAMIWLYTLEPGSTDEHDIIAAGWVQTWLANQVSIA